MQELDELVHSCFWTYHDQNRLEGSHTPHMQLSSALRWETRPRWIFSAIYWEIQFCRLINFLYTPWRLIISKKFSAKRNLQKRKTQNIVKSLENPGIKAEGDQGLLTTAMVQSSVSHWAFSRGGGGRFNAFLLAFHSLYMQILIMTLGVKERQIPRNPHYSSQKSYTVLSPALSASSVF